ncbi:MULTISPECIES: SDR family NAD(P)-dependent oxidoreductase [Haloferax]|uniref:SDR family oxidoreductase n=1 Tax=Haloferax sp. Atlit-48N TaxID=2077198 RepID=A0ACD5I1N5_9EURY|nr:MULTISPECIES: SDR family oxidoreductase [Haloferax]RDZ30899.1 3-ketoacyl-ACP reductase [Haloferax sp. Atlit-48N]RDZ38469.1 3-ketoacyl-ACP reductase [Haloferax sp. Atlit-47N]
MSIDTESGLLDGKTAIVTGASKGIGKAISELFAEEGASVVLTARGEGALNETVDGITSDGGNAIGVVADATDPASPERVFDRAIEEFGHVDILVNNAGYGEMVPIEDTTDEHFEETMSLNLFAAFRHSREAVQHFQERGEGAIVNVSSVNAAKPVMGVSYTTSKGALNTMTRNIAMRFAGTGIRCNAIAPGVTETPSAEDWRSGDMEGGNEIMDIAEKYVNLDVPDTEPLDQAYAALYLASDLSSAVTGQVLQIDNGGWL